MAMSLPRELPAVPMNSPFLPPLQYTLYPPPPPRSAFTRASVQQAASAMEPKAQRASDTITNRYLSQLLAIEQGFPFHNAKLCQYTFWLHRPDMEFTIIPWPTPMVATTPTNFAWALMYARQTGGQGAWDGITWLLHDDAQAFLLTNNIVIAQLDLPNREGINCWIRVRVDKFVMSLMQFETQYRMANLRRPVVA